MNLKKIVLSASALALVGGFAFGPSAMAHENDQINQDGVPVEIEGEQEGEGGYIVVKDQGVAPAPLNDGYIGVGGSGTSGPAVYGACEGASDDGEAGENEARFNQIDVTDGADCA